MLISSISADPAVAKAPDTTPGQPLTREIAAQNRDLSAAVKLLNEAGSAGNSHEFSIAIDPQTRQAVVRIVDLSTREVIEQFPSEYLLHVAQQLSERLAKQAAPAADKTL